MTALKLQSIERVKVRECSVKWLKEDSTIIIKQVKLLFCGIRGTPL